MIEGIRRVVNRWRYSRGMGRSTITPVRRDPDLDRYVGLWIAVKDGSVIAAAHNSRELVPMVRSMGSAGEGAVAQYVPAREDSIVIGVG